jgi:hypothetical protein
MRSASLKEIEYLSAIDGKQDDARLISEMSRRLDALRRFDQFCCSDGRACGRRRPTGKRPGKAG